MHVKTATAVFLFPLLTVSAAFAQDTLTLGEAMDRARTRTPEARALSAAEGEAAARVRQARAGYLPRVDVSETVQRGNQPVFVFSSLLGQRRFAEANFAVAALNEPDPVTNVRTFVGVDQVLFDSGATRARVRGSQIERDLAAARSDASRQDLALAAAQAFVRVLQLEAVARAATAAVDAAESDLQRARARRETGLVTPADVLAVEVHVADARQRAISAGADVTVARLHLGVAIGATADGLTLMRPSIPADPPAAEALIQQALTSRPELRGADLAVRGAGTARAAARAAFLPRLDLQGGMEFNGAKLTDQRSSWLLGANLQVNLFRGFADAAKVSETRQAEIRAVAEREAMARQVEVQVRASVARLDAARAREQVGRAALAQAREAHRILRDRYDTGLATVTDVLRAAEAVFEAESRATAAEMDVILDAIALDRAAGRL